MSETSLEGVDLIRVQTFLEALLDGLIDAADDDVIRPRLIIETWRDHAIAGGWPAATIERIQAIADHGNDAATTRANVRGAIARLSRMTG